MKILLGKVANIPLMTQLGILFTASISYFHSFIIQENINHESTKKKRLYVAMVMVALRLLEV
jgi:hypothetical protein